MKAFTIALAIGLAAFALAAPVATAAPDDSCVCPPDPCGPRPPTTDPWSLSAWYACKVLGGHPW